MKKIFINPVVFWVLAAIFLGCGLAFIGVSAVADPAAQGVSPYPGFLAPDFSLQNRDGEIITLSDLRGQVVVINLWASWCLPCRAEMPAMQEVYENKNDQPYEILAVNMTYQDEAAAAESFAAELGLTFPILFDHQGEVGPVYRLEALPTTFFVDRDGVIRDVVPGGPMTRSLIQSKIQSILND